MLCVRVHVAIGKSRLVGVRVKQMQIHVRDMQIKSRHFNPRGVSTCLFVCHVSAREIFVA